MAFYGGARGRDFGMSMSFGLSPYSASYYNQMRSDAYGLSAQAYGARYGTLFNGTIEYDRNRYEAYKLYVNNGSVTGYDRFVTPAMQNLIASANKMFGVLGQDDENEYLEISQNFHRTALDYMMTDGVQLKATFYVQGGYSVKKIDGKYYFQSGVNMKTFASMAGDVQFKGKATIYVDGKKMLTKEFGVIENPQSLAPRRGGTYFNRSDYSAVGGVSIELPTKGTVQVMLQFGYHFVNGTEAQNHSKWLVINQLLRTIGYPRKD